MRVATAVINLIKLSIKVFFEESKTKMENSIRYEYMENEWNKSIMSLLYYIWNKWVLCSSCGALSIQ